MCFHVDLTFMFFFYFFRSELFPLLAFIYMLSAFWLDTIPHKFVPKQGNYTYAFFAVELITVVAPLWWATSIATTPNAVLSIPHPMQRTRHWAIGDGTMANLTTTVIWPILSTVPIIAHSSFELILNKSLPHFGGWQAAEITRLFPDKTGNPERNRPSPVPMHHKNVCTNASITKIMALWEYLAVDESWRFLLYRDIYVVTTPCLPSI